MQVERWSVKNQCIYFTNFHDQSSQHPVNDFTTEKIGSSFDPPPPPHPTPTIKPTTTTTHTHNNNHKKQTKRTKQTQISTKTDNPSKKKKIPSTFNLFDCIVFCVLCWLFTSFYVVVFFLLLSVYFVAVDETNQTWTEWWKDKQRSSEQDKTWPTLPSIPLSCTIAHSLTVNSLQLDDSTAPLSDRQQPSAWR